MAYITLDIPPGLYRTGTDYKSKGRWLNANLWRWFSGEQRPVGGWVQKSIGNPVGGKARAMITWKTNGAKPWCAIGTHTGLIVMTSGGYCYGITPGGFTAGRADATTGDAYGGGAYGRGNYGQGQNGSDAPLADASMWSLDTWGEYLVGCMAEDGRIYQWALSPTTPAAAISGAPTAAAIVVTAERIMMALGAAGDPRSVMWSDREDNTDWTTTVTNYAGEFPLQTPGRLMCGRRVSGGTLLLTDVDAWLAQFVGQPLVYGFTKVGSQCGIVSRGAIVTTDVQAFWMSANGFWQFNGYSQPLPCDVHDYVFSNINTTQFSKVSAVHVSSFGEIWWLYPSAASIENDSYVIYNYRENHWNFGKITRLSGVDKGPFLYPMMCDDAGFVWDHENGVDHGGTGPFAESGPIELGDGDQTVMVRKIIPDVNNLGDVEVSFLTHIYPNDTAVTVAGAGITAQTDVRFSARSVSVQFNGLDNTDFRVGNFRFDVVTRGLR
jgi:hypothetical protein